MGTVGIRLWRALPIAARLKDAAEMTFAIQSGNSTKLGAHFDGEGVNFALFSEHASKVVLCLFSEDGETELQRLDLPERNGSVWHGYVPGLRPGALYGYRVEGPFAPELGHRFNSNKLLIDPYTRELHGPITYDRATLGYMPDSPDGDLSFSELNSAGFVPKSVVSHPKSFVPDATMLERRWDGSFIYETHVKGMTMLHPAVPQALRGTYDGLACDAVLDHLKRLGVTSVEIMPSQALHSEGALFARSLVNYWGYNTIGFFAPEPRYFGPAGVHGFRHMVDRFHAAGLEVILDVVYNHSAESDHLGPTLSFRGIDNASYYRLLEGQPRFYVNDTGTGNTLNLSHPFVLRMVMDSLRFWVQCMGVDGFRFDLATTLAREDHGFDPSGSFLDALRQDPVLSGAKLIAEPWDIGPGGYQLGRFPPEFAEWNDRFRDTARRFWRGDRFAAKDMGSALLGSADPFDTRGRQAWSSVNFVAAHDGFTLADATRYVERHNEANGEGNRDGHHANYGDNFGVEGETGDSIINAARRQRMRNLLATVFTSQGTPMLLAGDEMGNSQNGNNNAYCQDNATTWLDWEKADEDLIAFVSALSKVRSEHPVLTQNRFLHGAKRTDGLPDVEWRGLDGSSVNWKDPDLSALCLVLRGSAESAQGDCEADTVLVVINRDPSTRSLSLPAPGTSKWYRIIDSSLDVQTERAESGSVTMVPSSSVCLFALRA